MITVTSKILDYVEREYNNEDSHHWKFLTILGHIHTPVGHKDRMGSDYNVRTGWETRAVSVEPLDFLAKDIPVDLAMYAKKHDLLEKEGWKRFRRIANRDKHLQSVELLAQFSPQRTIYYICRFASLVAITLRIAILFRKIVRSCSVCNGSNKVL
jgi:hypothetical protein